MRVVHGEEVALWAGAQLGVTFQEPYTAFGFADDRGFRGASIFNDYYRGGNVEWTYVGPQSFTRSSLRFMCRFAFDELEAARVTAKTRRGNVIARRMLPRGGFLFEGVQKRYFGPSKADDALVYVLWPEQAQRWIKNGAAQ